MTDNPDLQRLAARYLDLWQEQVAQMAGDPVLSDVMAKSLGMIRERWDEAAQQFQQGGGDRNAAQPAGTASPAVPSDDAGGQLAVLLERVAGLEERLARLEQAVVGRGKRAAGGNKPRRSGKLSKSAG
jgi:ubiquinone biosynthesis protein UbiJ